MTLASVRLSALSAPIALAWSLGLTVLLSGAGVLLMRSLGASRVTLLLLAIVEVGLYGGAALALGRRYGAPQPSAALALGRARPLDLGVAGSLGVIVHLPAGYLDAMVERRFPTPRERLLEQLEQLTPTSTLHALSLLVGIAVLAPLAEELFFRGALFTALARTGHILIAVWTTSIAFVLAHQEPRMWAPLLLVALVLAELRRASQSIWPSVLMHATFNATTLLSIFRSEPGVVRQAQLPLWLALLGGVLTLAGIWIVRRPGRAKVRAS